MNIRDCLRLERLRSENLDSRIGVPGGVQGARVEKAREQRWLARRQRWIGRREQETKARRRGTRKWKNYEAALMNARFEKCSRGTARNVLI